MRIVNHLPVLRACLERWASRPSLAQFRGDYWTALEPELGGVFGDGAERLWRVLLDLDWERYRAETLPIDPDREQARLVRCLEAVEGLFGVPLEGEVVLFGAFTCMDGYARFDRGRHRVFLGVDESHGRGAYLDILISHELTHVVRETRPEVWTGWGLPTDLDHDGFEEHLPVVEHLANEGISCLASELLHPGHDPWHYAYQEEDGLQAVLLHAPAVDRVIHEELAKGSDGDYGQLYDRRRYGRGMPMFAHYVWAWQWTKHLLRDVCGGDVRALVGRCSKDFLEDALSWRLEGLHLEPGPEPREG